MKGCEYSWREEMTMCHARYCDSVVPQLASKSENTGSNPPCSDRISLEQNKLIWYGTVGYVLPSVMRFGNTIVFAKSSLLQIENIGQYYNAVVSLAVVMSSTALRIVLLL